MAPNQVIKEFWDNRDNIIRDSREVDKTTRELKKHLSGADRDLRFWAKRVRLPSDRIKELATILTDAFGELVGEVQKLAVDDGREFARDTNSDPLLKSLDPILRDSVGSPFDAEEHKRALAEARRRGVERIPPATWTWAKKVQDLLAITCSGPSLSKKRSDGRRMSYSSLPTTRKTGGVRIRMMNPLVPDRNW